MKRLVTSDLQLDDNPRDRYRTDFMVNELPKLIAKYKIDQLLVLGDICELKDRHPAPLVNDIVNCFTKLAQLCEVVILQGNHDYLHIGHPYFEFLTNFENVSWISAPTVRDNCLYLPHTRDHKKDWKDLKFDGFEFIFAHNIFTGVTANGIQLSGIPGSVFPDDAQVVSGDVHEPQSLDNGKIVYVGSPVLCDFGDSYQPRVLLLDGLDIKSIKVHGQQKRLINCSVDKIAGKRELNFDHDANENDIVKIKVSLMMDDVAEWATIRQEVADWAAEHKFIVNTIQPIVDYVQGARPAVVKNKSKSDIQFLESYVKRLGADEKVAEIGKELLEG